MTRRILSGPEFVPASDQVKLQNIWLIEEMLMRMQRSLRDEKHYLLPHREDFRSAFEAVYAEWFSDRP